MGHLNKLGHDLQNKLNSVCFEFVIVEISSIRYHYWKQMADFSYNDKQLQFYIFVEYEWEME